MKVTARALLGSRTACYAKPNGRGRSQPAPATPRTVRTTDPQDPECDPAGAGRAQRNGVTGNATGVRRLALAVLTEAVRCFQENASGHDRRSRRLFREAEEWLMGNGDPEFSFEEICEALKLDASYLRHGLQRWRARWVH